jgi:hypothetical protein
MDTSTADAHASRLLTVVSCSVNQALPPRCFSRAPAALGHARYHTATSPFPAGHTGLLPNGGAEEARLFCGVICHSLCTALHINPAAPALVSCAVMMANARRELFRGWVFDLSLFPPLLRWTSWSLRQNFCQSFCSVRSGHRHW